MAPYRSGRQDPQPQKAPQPGLVADMVRQFADPYAFLRELVQNGMDAGATKISVRIELLPQDLCATSVMDNGAGMHRDVVEGPLLTLFSSSKEGDLSKIGKYGVGFVSVFALEPREVQVDTWQSGQAWLIRLHGDHSYEIEDAGPREGSGTRVTLLLPMQREAFTEHLLRVRVALRRWCRHSQCEIELRVIDDIPGSEPTLERIDAPLSIVAPVSIRVVELDTTFVLGPSAGLEHLRLSAEQAWQDQGKTFAGFYNRGLTLFETSDEVFQGLHGIRFKVMSPRFQHTLSRDNVRRDEAFWHALTRLRDLVKGPLRKELKTRLERAATAVAEGNDHAEYMALLEAALSPPTNLDVDEIPFPLAHPFQGARALSDLRSLLPWGQPLLRTQTKNALTAALAKASNPVVLCVEPPISTSLKRCYPKLEMAWAHEAYLLISAILDKETKQDELLKRVLFDALTKADHQVEHVAFCKVSGALSKRAGILVPKHNALPQLCSVVEVERNGSRWKSGCTLWLNVNNETVALARKKAVSQPVAAGTILTRLLLVEARGPLGASDSDSLLDLGHDKRK